MNVLLPLLVTLIGCTAFLAYLNYVYTAYIEVPLAFTQVSVYVPVFTTLAYFGFVWLGPQLMKSRAPLDVKYFMIFYNLFEIVFNVCFVCAVYLELQRRSFPLWSLPVSLGVDQNYLGYLLFFNYLNKYVELLDTVFMVVRKKENQLSFLHVWHHILIIWSWWYCCHDIGGSGESYFGATVNAAIHILMYAYYLLALLKIRCPWKIYLTTFQIGQFYLCASHSVYGIYSGVVPLRQGLCQLNMMIQMIILFGQFYRSTYVQKKKA